MKRAITILVIIIVVAGVAAAAYMRFGSQGAKAAPPTSGQTASVTVGSLAATVAGAGNITSHAAVDLSFGASGVVTVEASIRPGYTGALLLAAQASSTAPDPVPADNSVTASTQVFIPNTLADLQLAFESPPPATAHPGDPFSYTLRFANLGPAGAGYS